MIVSREIASIWQAADSRAQDRLNTVFGRAPQGASLFFRADDVAVPGRNMQRMVDVFRENRAPLALAVVPAWLRPDRWAELYGMAGKSTQWCWHQHGWRHENHQASGKKGEFGDHRGRAAKKRDLIRGRDKLAEMMGQDFQRFFTPPWNRFDHDTGELLHELEFDAVSRSTGAMKKVGLPDGLEDFHISVDLHIRKERDVEQAWAGLFDELETGLGIGRCGIMLHHQRANEKSWEFVSLLCTAARRFGVEIVGFPEMTLQNACQ